MWQLAGQVTYNYTEKVIEVAGVWVREGNELCHVQVVERISDHVLHFDDLAVGREKVARMAPFLVSLDKDTPFNVKERLLTRTSF